jgi:hypothetical protein
MTILKFLKPSKRFGIYTGLTILLFINCSKQNNNTATGYWSVSAETFVATRYNINYTSRLDSLGFSVLKGSDSLPSSLHPTVNSIYLWFNKDYPVRNGSYEMVNVHYPPYALSDSQMGISGILPYGPFGGCSNDNIAQFDATGIASRATWPFTPSSKAELTVVNGKIKVIIPRTIAVYVKACFLDSPYLDLTFQEK